MQHLAGAHDQRFTLIVAKLEAEGALEDIGELLVLVRMSGNDAAFLEINVGEHHSVAGNEPTVEHVVDALLRHVFPAVERRAAFE